MYIPFEAAKVTPPLGKPSSVIEIQENINKFPKLANYGRQELFYILIRDYDQMLSNASSQGNFAESYNSLKILIEQEYNLLCTKLTFSQHIENSINCISN